MTNTHIIFMGLVVISMAACGGFVAYLILVRMPEDRRIDNLQREDQLRYQRIINREMTVLMGRMLLGLHYRDAEKINAAIREINVKTHQEAAEARGPQTASHPRRTRGVLAGAGR